MSFHFERKHAPVAVIIPCYYCAETIERAVISVINQALPPAEIWLVDDASPDDGETISILNSLQVLYRDKTVIHVLPLQINRGPAGARNAAWEATSQPYIAFLDADDAWHPQKIECQYNWMAAHPDVALTGHPSVLVKEGEPIGNIPGIWDSWPVTPLNLLCSNRFPTRSVMLHSDLPFRFKPEKRYSEDYLLWLQIVLSGEKAFYLDLPLSFIFKKNYGEGGLSADLWRMEQGELDSFWQLRAENRISFFSALALSIWSLLKYLRRLIVSAFPSSGASCHTQRRK